jgi:hypothetical protein
MEGELGCWCDAIRAMDGSGILRFWFAASLWVSGSFMRGRPLLSSSCFWGGVVGLQFAL